MIPPTKQVIQQAEQAKNLLREIYEKHPGFCGVGIVPSSNGGLAIRINIDPSTEIENLPDEFEGFLLQKIYTKGYKARK